MGQIQYENKKADRLSGVTLCFFSCGATLPRPRSYEVQLQEGQPTTSTDMEKPARLQVSIGLMACRKVFEMKEEGLESDETANGENQALSTIKLEKYPPGDRVT